MHLLVVLLLQKHVESADKMRCDQKLGEPPYKVAPYAQKLEI